jgi:NAD(P) transhydrogenase subunit beta
MTGMPELVAVLHSFVGLAAVFVGISSFVASRATAHTPRGARSIRASGAGASRRDLDRASPSAR